MRTLKGFCRPTHLSTCAASWMSVENTLYSSFWRFAKRCSMRILFSNWMDGVCEVLDAIFIVQWMVNYIQKYNKVKMDLLICGT